MAEEDVLYENQKIIAENQQALQKQFEDKITRLEQSLKDALTPKEIKEEAAKQREVTYADLERLKGETADAVTSKLEEKERIKSYEKEGSAKYDEFMTEMQSICDANGGEWSEELQDMYNALAKEVVSVELQQAAQGNRGLNWDNVKAGINKRMLKAMKWDVNKEKEEITESTSTEAKPKAAMKPTSLTGLADEISFENIKGGKLDELETALKSGKITDYDELSKMHERIMDLKNSLYRGNRRVSR